MKASHMLFVCVQTSLNKRADSSTSKGSIMWSKASVCCLVGPWLFSGVGSLNQLWIQLAKYVKSTCRLCAGWRLILAEDNSASVGSCFAQTVSPVSCKVGCTWKEFKPLASCSWTLIKYKFSTIQPIMCCQMTVFQYLSQNATVHGKWMRLLID